MNLKRLEAMGLLDAETVKKIEDAEEGAKTKQAEISVEWETEKNRVLEFMKTLKHVTTLRVKNSEVIAIGSVASGNFGGFGGTKAPKTKISVNGQAVASIDAFLQEKDYPFQTIESGNAKGKRQRVGSKTAITWLRRQLDNNKNPLYEVAIIS